MGQTDWPWLGRVVLLRAVEVGHPDYRSMIAPDLVADPVAPARANHRHTDRGMLKDPFPWGAAVYPGAGFITADQPAAAPTGQDLRDPIVQTAFHPPAELRQGPFADGHAVDLREERRQPRVTDGMGISQVGRQTLDRGPKRRAGLHPHGDRSHIGLPTGGTLPSLLLHSGHDGLDRWELDLVIHRMGLLLVGLHCAATMRTGLRLGHADLVRLRVQWPAPSSTAHTGLATRPRTWACGEVRLRGVRGRNTRMVGILARLVRFGFECRQLGFQTLHLRPQRSDEGILFRFR
jgi:hypothetical protein